MLEIYRSKLRSERKRILRTARTRNGMTAEERARLNDLHAGLRDLRHLKNELLDEVDEICTRGERDGGLAPADRERIFAIAGLLQDPEKPGLQVRILRIINGSSPATTATKETA